MIDWNRFSSDLAYRDHVLKTVSATQDGRDWLAKFVGDLRPSIEERLRLYVQAQIPREYWHMVNKSDTVSGIGAFPLLAAIPALVAKGALIKTGLVAAATAGKAVIVASWGALAKMGAGKLALFAVGAFFATDYIASKLQGHKAEIEKLYAQGKKVASATVSSGISLINMVPIIVVGTAFYLFMKGIQNGKA